MKKWLLFSVSCLLSFICMATPLPANDVFQVGVKRVDPNNFVVNWEIKPGYFLYSDRIKLTAPADSNFHLGAIRFPTPLQKTDSQGRTHTVYRQQLNLPVAILGERAGEGLLDLHYQGCADDGFCYPPETRQLKISIDENLALASVEFYKPDNSITNAPEETANNTVESIFLNHHWAMILLIFFGFGLLLSFTPCVLPMVPVLSGIIVGHGHTISTRKAFFLSLSYVLSMAFTYAIVGAVVALLSNNLQIIMQAPWVIGLFSALFVVLALSMFGYYELKLPVSWQVRLAKANRSHGSGHYLSAAIMGCLSTLILSPCVTAPLIGVLGYIAHSGNVAMGFFCLLFLGLGMGTPLLLIGTSARRWLPKTGKWMNAVKSFFGVLLLAVAINLLSRILPAPLIMGLWAALLIFSGIYIGALGPAYTHHDKFFQAAGIILLVYGLLVLIGASMGGSNPLQPLASWAGRSNVSATASTDSVKTVKDVQTAIEKASGKLVMIDFYADWCTSCKIMEATTFKDPAVLKALQNVVVLKANITANDAKDKALLRKYNVVAPPTFLFFNKEGEELTQQRLVGENNAQEFLKHLQPLLSHPER
ncbi:MAG: protein-disulfide reductase DsbD [Legionella sp.]|nr:protein-disulfide reductase DsbD [Legionella sp.]